MPDSRRPPNAASVALIDRDRVLLIQRARKPYFGMWSLPGGRLEPGETAEQAHQGEDRVRPQPFVQPVPSECPAERGHEEHEADLGEEREVRERSPQTVHGQPVKAGAV